MPLAKANKYRKANDSDSRDRAIAYCASIRFHQSFFLKANLDAGRPAPIRVTYADLDYRQDRSLDKGPVLLIVGGLGGGRFLTLGSVDDLAKEYKIRVICPDKLGTGGSGSAPLEHRIQAWLDLVADLLAYLNVKHVTLLAHSAGAIYLFNTLISQRHLLHPTNPYIVFLCPWVHPSRSGCLKSHIIVPSFMFRIACSPPLNEFYESYVANPYRFITSLPKAVSKKIILRKRQLPQEASKPSTPSTERKIYYDPEISAIQHHLYDLEREYSSNEEMSGAGDEVLLCLQRGKAKKWGLFKDYSEAVFLMENGATAGEQSHLTVHMFFAQTDELIGEKGAQWFDSCWRPQWRSHGEKVFCWSFTPPSSTHNNIWHPNLGVIESVMRTVVSLWGTYDTETAFPVDEEGISGSPIEEA